MARFLSGHDEHNPCREKAACSVSGLKILQPRFRVTLAHPSFIDSVPGDQREVEQSVSELEVSNRDWELPHSHWLQTAISKQPSLPSHKRAGRRIQPRASVGEYEFQAGLEHPQIVG